MPKFSVLVTRDITESTIVEIEADNAEEAEELAIDEAFDGDYSWATDCNPVRKDDHYVTNVEAL